MMNFRVTLSLLRSDDYTCYVVTDTFESAVAKAVETLGAGKPKITMVCVETSFR